MRNIKEGTRIPKASQHHTPSWKVVQLLWFQPWSLVIHTLTGTHQIDHCDSVPQAQNKSVNQGIWGKILACWYQMNATETVPIMNCDKKEVFITHYLIQSSRSTSIYLLLHTTGASKAASCAWESPIVENLPNLSVIYVEIEEVPHSSWNATSMCMHYHVNIYVSWHQNIPRTCLPSLPFKTCSREET